MSSNSQKKWCVVIDVQNDFIMPNGALYIKGAETILPHYQTYFRNMTPENGYEGVLFSFDTHYVDTYDSYEESKEFPPHCIHSTSGWTLSVDPKLIPKSVPQFMARKAYFDVWQENVEVIPFPEPRTSHPILMDKFIERMRGCLIEVVGVFSDYSVKMGNARVSEKRIFSSDRYTFVSWDSCKHELWCYIEVIGVSSDYCVRYAILGFLERGFTVRTDPRLCTGIYDDIVAVIEELKTEKFQGNSPDIEAVNLVFGKEPVNPCPWKKLKQAQSQDKF